MTFEPRREWRLLLAAVQVLTRIPVTVGPASAWGPDTLRHATRYMPLVGLGIGLVAAAVFAAARAGLPPVPAALLALAATLLLTGALHEDGLADCCDGFGGGRTRADALRIMRDSRIGAFGALGLAVVVGTKVACVAALPHPERALAAAAASSRFWAVLPPAVLPYARDADGGGGMAGAVAGPGGRDLLGAAACGLLPLLLLGPRAVPALLLAGLVAGALGVHARRRLGGYTGDVLGATQQLTEAAVLLAALWTPAWDLAWGSAWLGA